MNLQASKTLDTPHVSTMSLLIVAFGVFFAVHVERGLPVVDACQRHLLVLLALVQGTDRAALQLLCGF